MERREIPGEHARSDSGFSLVESVVAMVFAIVVILSMVRSQLTSLSVIRTSSEAAIIVNDLRSAMEGILTMRLEDIPIAGSEAESGLPIVQYDNLHLKSQTIVPTYPGYTLGGPVPNPLTIVLTANWRDASNRFRSIQIRTVKVK